MARDYKKEYQTQLARGEHPDRMERQRARRALDAKGVVSVLRNDGVSTKVATVALARFTNEDGLKNLGGSIVGEYGFTGSLTAVVLGGRVAGQYAAAEALSR